MFLSVILSTFNSPTSLAKVLWGYAAQTHRDFEIVVADDGSSLETARGIREFAKTTGLRVNHVWQSHEGFRKCRALNLAILEAQNEYLVFSDGDCIPRRDFLAVHHNLARPGRFLSGGILRLPQTVSEKVTREPVMTGQATDYDWLARNGFWRLKNVVRLTTHGPLATAADWLTPTRATFNGHNASAWKSDVVRVNGFDERMVYGGLDRELGERLINAGVRPLQIRHRAVVVHLDHARPYVNEQGVAANRELRKETQRSGTSWTPYGLSQHVASGHEQKADPPRSLPLPQRRAA